MRRNQFTIDAESVQGNAGAEVTFKGLLVEEVHEYRTTSMTDAEILQTHILGWKGIVDDKDKALPSPVDEPGILSKLYIHEVQRLARLLWDGPDGENAKN